MVPETNLSSSQSRHGLNSLKARVKVRGLAAIDRRTAAARALIAWRNELIVDLGGDHAVSAQQRALIDVATRPYSWNNRLKIGFASALAVDLTPWQSKR